MVSAVVLWSNISVVVHGRGSLKVRCENSATCEILFYWNITNKGFVRSSNLFLKFRDTFDMNTV